MGILNVTPDSFSDGGKFNTLDAALRHTEQMIADGASIIDVGGESTKPGYTPVPADVQIERVVPVIEKIKANFDIPVSVDTTDAVVAKASIDAGCDLINDIWGLKKDGNLAKVVADSGLPVVLMHNRENTEYKLFFNELISDLKESVRIAEAAGIGLDKIILDPGIGFAKDVDQNLEAINKLEKIRELGYPVLLGTSRKSVIGKTLDLPVDERLEGTLATTVIGVMKGCGIIRVHDVKENIRAVKMAEAILNANGHY
ncbi:MAG: dihydropteroate synthase [Lachnospiraceae bacterium]|nr:dihydropteroate synthase [Lachnospiraceae bacterium]